MDVVPLTSPGSPEPRFGIGSTYQARDNLGPVRILDRRELASELAPTLTTFAYLVQTRNVIEWWLENDVADTVMAKVGYEVGARIRFTHSGNVYRITAVDEEQETVTFARPDDPQDATTETFAGLDGHVTVLPPGLVIP